MRTFAVAALAVLAALPAVAPAAEACAVPCGYVYPLIRLLVPDAGPLALEQGATLEVEATMVFQFDAGNEGAGPEEPGKPIVVSFEYPKKPRWLEVVAEPENVEVRISPQHFRANASDPMAPKLLYVHESPVTFRLRIVDTPVLRQGVDVQKVLVFAKSTESGLYKPAYGIKELRVVPEGAVHAPAPTALDAPDAPDTPLAPQSLPLGDGSVALTPLAAEMDLWAPTPFVVALDPPRPAVLNVAVVDESARVLYSTGNRLRHDGSLHVNLTFAEPGLHHVLAFAFPLDGAFAPRTVAFPLATPPVEGPVRMEQEYQALWSEAVTELRGDAADPAAQYEKFIPLPIHEGASSGQIALVLRTTGLAPADGGVANVNLQVLDPNGAVVAQGVVDAFNPVKTVAVAGWPGAGWYQLRLFGAGANLNGLQGATVDVAVRVAYDGRPVVESANDGALDAPSTSAAYGRLNATLPAPLVVDPWTPVDVQADLAFAGSPAVGFRHAPTLLDPAGRTAAAWLAEDGRLAGTFTFPQAGRHLVVFLVDSTDRDWQAVPLVFVAEARAARASSFALATEAATIPGSAAPTPFAVFAVPVREGASDGTVSAPGARLVARGPDGAVGAEGEGTLELPPGDWLVEVAAPSVAGGRVTVAADVAYAAPVALDAPGAPVEVPAPEQGVPAAGWLAALAVVALAASSRRRR